LLERARVKSLYNPALALEVKKRVGRLTPQSARQWGKMDAAQAVAHCAVSMEWAVGDKKPQRMFVGRLLGAVVKPLVLKDDAPMRRNSPTSPDLVVADARELALEQERLCGLIDRFASAGPAGCTRHPHSFFGRMKPEQWAVLMYKHLDHHLRQFGV
jgi:hypothetical protein